MLREIHHRVKNNLQIVSSLHRQGLVTLINPIATAMTGYEPMLALGQDIGQIFRLIWETDGAEIENPSSCAMRLRQPIKSPARCWLVAKDGTEIPISDTATPIFNFNFAIESFRKTPPPS